MWASCVRQMKSIITSGPGKIHEVGGIAVKKIAQKNYGQKTANIFSVKPIGRVGRDFCLTAP